MTTIDNITDAQIEALRTEASEAGDQLMIAYCQLALGHTPRVALSTTRYGARCECARVIAAAEAQS